MKLEYARKATILAGKTKNEQCFRPLFCTVKAELGRGQPGLMRWIWDETLPQSSIETKDWNFCPIQDKYNDVFLIYDCQEGFAKPGYSILILSVVHGKYLGSNYLMNLKKKNLIYLSDNFCLSRCFKLCKVNSKICCVL